MTSIKGVYENGQIKLLEPAPGKEKTKVIITFLEHENQNEENEIRNISLSHTGKFFEDYLSDEREDLYQEYAKRKTE